MVDILSKHDACHVNINQHQRTVNLNKILT